MSSGCTPLLEPSDAFRRAGGDVARAIEDGAAEMDMVLNIGRLLSGRDVEVKADIAAS